MTLEEECILSYYKEIAEINSSHNVFMVQHVESKKIFVKKVLNEYSRMVYEYIKNNHSPYFPEIIELIEDDGKLILIEEYISGRTLGDILREKGTLSIEETIDIVEKICKGLSFLHNARPQIVHRDIKPDNIMVTGDGNVKLIDINIAKTHKQNEKRDTNLFGTNGYAAPEQYGFGQSDSRADVYAVGVLINVMLTGEFPYEKKVSGRMGMIVDKCMKLEPTERYQSVDELASDLLRGNYTSHGNNKTKKPYITILIIVITFLILIISVLAASGFSKRTAIHQETSGQDAITRTSAESGDLETEPTTEEKTTAQLPEDTEDEKYRRNMSGNIVKFTRKKWPENGIAKSLPIPDAEFINISIEQNDTLSVNMLMTKEEYDYYVEACLNKGYDKKYHKGDTYFSAENSAGNRLAITYYTEYGYVHLSLYNWS